MGISLPSSATQSASNVDDTGVFEIVIARDPIEGQGKDPDPLFGKIRKEMGWFCGPQDGRFTKASAETPNLLGGLGNLGSRRLGGPLPMRSYGSAE